MCELSGPSRGETGPVSEEPAWSKRHMVSDSGNRQLSNEGCSTGRDHRDIRSRGETIRI